MKKYRLIMKSKILLLKIYQTNIFYKKDCNFNENLTKNKVRFFCLYFLTIINLDFYQISIIISMKTSNTPIHLIAISIFVSFIFLYPIKTTKVSNCGKAGDKFPTVFEDPTTRNLQGFINPHGFRIKFLAPPSTVSFNLTEVKNMYAIAATFFKQLIKVTDVADSIRYTLTYNCGTITPNSIYATSGFNFG